MGDDNLKDELKTTASGCGYVIANIFITIIGSGFVFMKIWEWTVVEIFKFPSVNFFQSLGICLLIGFVLNRNKEETKATFTHMILNPVLRYSIALGLVFLFKQWY